MNMTVIVIFLFFVMRIVIFVIVIFLARGRRPVQVVRRSGRRAARREAVAGGPRVLQESAHERGGADEDRDARAQRGRRGDHGADDGQSHVKRRVHRAGRVSYLMMMIF